MPDPGQAMIVAPVVCALVGAVLAPLLQRVPDRSLACGYGAAALSGLLATVAGGRVLFGAASPRLPLFAVLPANDLAIRLTPLSAFFWLVCGLPVTAVGIFAVGYARHYRRRLSLGLLGAVFNLFVLSLLLVTAADNALGFLIAWETMALLSYLLVVYDHHDRAVVRAGLLYAIMTHIGTACIVLCFLVLAGRAPGSSLDFAALHTAGAGLTTFSATAVFLLALVGFGVKAGVMPLHVWLPRAHPVAPSHVSALMSGVMIKTGIYGMVLVWFGFLPAGPLWWGLLVLALGSISAFLGILYALMQHDLKRLLAYSSVENVGIILMALGAALLFRSSGATTLAAFALAAGLFHTLNHAVFKTLLFLCAGSVQNATHTRDLARLGGLMRRMPWTGACFLVGAAAIVALPPLNAFASEWLIFQSLLDVGIHVGTAGVGGVALLAASALALCGALAAACFVKAVGICFLGQSRTPAAASAHEAGLAERVGMVLPALACVALGLAPPLVLRMLGPVTIGLLGASPPGQGSWLVAVRSPGAAGGTALHPIALLAFLAGFGLLGAILVGAVRRARGHDRVAKTWSCGVVLTPRMQYSATSFAQPIRRMFSAIVWPDRTVDVGYAHPPYFISTISYQVSLKPLFQRFLYLPVRAAFLRCVAVLRVVQNGSIHAYLGYVFVALVAALVAAR
jgi:hydrogenase-4 component B